MTYRIRMNPPHSIYVDDQAECSDHDGTDVISISSDEDSDDSFVVADDVVSYMSDVEQNVIDLTMEDDDDEGQTPFVTEESLAHAIDEIRSEIYTDLHEIPIASVMDLWNGHLSMVFHYSTQIAGLSLHRGDIISRNHRLIGMHMFRARSISNFLEAKQYPPWLAFAQRILEQDIPPSSHPNSDDDLESDGDN